MTSTIHANGNVTFGDLVRLVGQDACDKIALARGGDIIYIPRAFRADSPIVGVVGEEVAAALAAAFPGVRVLVPVQRAKLLQIRRLRKSGMKVWQIARQMSCTKRTIYSALAQFDPADTERQGSSSGAQLDLFKDYLPTLPDV